MSSSGHIYAGFNLTKTKLQVSEVAVVNNEINLVNVDEVYLNEEINFERDKVSKIGALLQSAYQELQLNSSINPNYISFCLPLELFSIIQLPLDNRISYQEAIEDLKIQYKILFPFRDEKLTIHYYKVDPNQFNKYTEAIAFGIEEQYLSLIANFAQNNQLKLLYIDNPLTASIVSVNSSNSVLCKGYYLIIYLEKNIAAYCFINANKAIKIKSFYYNRIGDLPEILNKEFNSEIFSIINSDSIDSSFITGDDISSNLVSLLRKSLNIDFIMFNPFDKLKVSQELFENKSYLKKYNSFAASLGIALRVN